jgi:hypothetical protein
LIEENDDVDPSAVEGTESDSKKATVEEENRPDENDDGEESKF